MISFPPGFDYSLLITDLLTVGTVFLPIIAGFGIAFLVMKTLKRL